MSESLPPPYPPDDERLADLETYLTVQLMYVRSQRASRARQREIQQRTAPPAPPPYRIQRSLDAGRTPVRVHLGTCVLAGRGAAGVSPEAARQALAGHVEACAVCRPDTELGMIEG
ncbi:DUF6233 domain-containing protein [Streptomyces ficellus]|uniref:Uncharacterized protein n=1 Tax=Streptomyces ficellus TaxID=1977088 RepID=A0A6I6FPB0_9ACTN|nr:DUF6233 domain-containing protein [Streptomyces ficellus]QGV82192.1 hypothetical protein EIZ62_30990 [Streptomyces ficellus]